MFKEKFMKIDVPNTNTVVMDRESYDVMNIKVKLYNDLLEDDDYFISIHDSGCSQRVTKIASRDKILPILDKELARRITKLEESENYFKDKNEEYRELTNKLTTELEQATTKLETRRWWKFK